MTEDEYYNKLKQCDIDVRNTIKKEIQDRQLTVKQLYEMTNVNKTSLYSYLSSKTGLVPTNMCKLLKILSMDTQMKVFNLMHDTLSSRPVSD